MSFHSQVLQVLAPGGKRARLMIFSYHRVPKIKDALLPNEPSGAEFERHIQYVSRFLNPVRLADVPQMLAQDTLPARAVCITLDDGYENNLSVAAPILKKYGVPATVFVAVQPVVQGIMWNDLAIEAIRNAGDEIDLTREGLGVYKLPDTKSRLQLVDKLPNELKYREPNERWELARALYARVTGRETPRLMMREEQLVELHRFGVDVGAHTMTHPILTKISDDEARKEIEDSRQWLNNAVQRDVDTFAYPNGRPGIDYSPQHANMVAEAGFKAAVSTVWGCATRSSSVFELPRFTPWEYEQRPFLQRLEKTLLRSYWPPGS